jgi:hypothetical protein
VQGWYGKMQTNIVKVKDLIELYPEDHKAKGKCKKCGGTVYKAHNVADECENVIFKNGLIWDESPCDYMIMGG